MQRAVAHFNSTITGQGRGIGEQMHPAIKVPDIMDDNDEQPPPPPPTPPRQPSDVEEDADHGGRMAVEDAVVAKEASGGDATAVVNQLHLDVTKVATSDAAIKVQVKSESEQVRHRVRIEECGSVGVLQCVVRLTQ